MNNRSIGIYEGGAFIPNVHDAKALAGYDVLADKFYFVATDEDGALLCRQQVVNVDTLEWENVTGGEVSPLSRYAITDMDDAADPAYYGYVDQVGNWYIMRMTTAGEVRYAKGASGYAAAWTARAGQSYGLFNATF
jgi:hypothetical protein